jgi:predicted DNA-binding protein
MKGRTETLTIRLSPEVKAALERLAASDRRPVSQYVALLIEDHVKARGSTASKD